jgi:hypothetical protein
MMMWRRLGSVLLVAALAASQAPIAHADDDEGTAAVDEAVSKSLYEQGVKLYHAGNYADARELFVEAYTRSPKGPYAKEARGMILRCNQKLGITDPLPPEPPADDTPQNPYTDDGATVQDPYADDGAAKKTDDGEKNTGNDQVQNPYVDQDHHSQRASVDREEITPAPIDPYAPKPDVLVSGGGGEPADEGSQESRNRVALSGTTYGAALGVELFGLSGKGGTAVVGGLIGGGAGAYFGWHVGKRHITEGELLASDSMSAWGMGEGLWIAHVANAKTGKGYAGGALVGTSLGVLTGYWIAKEHPSPGHVALANSFGGYGAVGGLLVGVMMRPYSNRAYSLNAVLGSTGGLIVGALVAKGRGEISRERLAWIDLAVAGGGAAGWIVYLPAAKNAHATQIAAGFSMAGMAVGGYLGWRWTKKIGRHHVLEKSDLAGAGALIAHSDRGGWSLGAPILHPMTTDVSKGFSLGIDVLSGSF